jgi:hypothetical protein
MTLTSVGSALMLGLPRLMRTEKNFDRLRSSYTAASCVVRS